MSPAPFAAITALIRTSARKKILFLSHAVRQMSRPDRMIATPEVRRVVLRGEIIEHYTEDVRGDSCLVLGFGEGGRPIHVVCAPKGDYLAIITAYLPEPREWQPGFRERKRR